MILTATNTAPPTLERTMLFLAVAELPTMRHPLPLSKTWQVRLEIAAHERGSWGGGEEVQDQGT